MLQNHFLSFGMLNLILFDNIFLDDRFHCKELFRIFLFYKQHCSKGSFSQDDLGNEIIYWHFFLEVMTGIKCFSCLSNHLLLLLLPVKIFFEGNVVMKDVLPLDVFDPFLLFFFFCSCIVHKVQLITVVDGKLVATRLADCPKNAVDDLVSSVGGSISDWISKYR